MVGPTSTTAPSQTLPPASSTTPSGTSNESEAKVDAYEIGWQFVQQYYTMLHFNPEKLSSFYAPSALLLRGTEGEAVSTSLGTKEIQERIKTQQFQDCKVLVSSVDVQGSVHGCIIVQAIGELANNGGLAQRFVQTFCLAESQGTFAVVNDIFRFIVDNVYIPSSTKTTAAAAAPQTNDATKGAAGASSGKPAAGAKAALAKTGQAAKVEENKKESAAVSVEKAAEDKATEQKSNIIAPKSWANITSTNKDKWGNRATAPVSGVVVAPTAASIAAAAAKGGAPQTETKSGATSSPVKPKDAHSDKDTQQLQVKGIRENVHNKVQLHGVLSTFGEIRSLDINKNMCTLEYASPESTQKALAANHIMLNAEKFSIVPNRNHPANNNNAGNRQNQGNNSGFDSRRGVSNNGGFNSQRSRGGGHQHHQSLDHNSITSANFEGKGGNQQQQRRTGGSSTPNTNNNSHRNSSNNSVGRGGSRSNTPAMQQQQDTTAQK